MPETAGTPPATLWAQRSDFIILTVNVECKDPKIEWTENSLTFSGTGLPENKLYEVTINFYGKIKPNEVASKNISRCIEFVVPKAESGPYWPHLTAEKKKYHWLKVDFNKWVDEGSDGSDEEGSRKGMESIDDLIRKVDHLGGPGDSKPSFDDLDDDEKDSDDDEMPNLVA